jgi:hypothetical protein
MGEIDKDRMLAFRGETLLDQDGEKIGKIVEMYLDADSGEPEWALVHTGLFGKKQTFVPLQGASEEEGALRVPHAKKLVADAPHIDPTGQLTKDQESNLYRHFHIDHRDRAVDHATGDPAREPQDGDERPAG